MYVPSLLYQILSLGYLCSGERIWRDLFSQLLTEISKVTPNTRTHPLITHLSLPTCFRPLPFGLKFQTFQGWKRELEFVRLPFVMQVNLSFFHFFPQQRKLMGLQPRIAPVCTGAGAGSGSTRFRRRFRRFRRRSGRLWCRACRSRSTGFRRRFRRSPEKVWEALVQSQIRFNKVPDATTFTATAKP